MMDHSFLVLFADVLHIKLKLLYQAIYDVTNTSLRSAREICSGRTTFPGWPLETLEAIILKMIDLRYEEIRQHPATSHSLRSDNIHKRYLKRQREKAETFKQQATELKNRFYFISSPDIEKTRIFSQREYALMTETETAFKRLSIEHAYTLVQNKEAFRVLSTPDVSAFYKHILQLDEAGKYFIRDWIFEISITLPIRTLLELSDNPAIQQWRRILRPEYEKSVAVQLNNEQSKGKQVKPRAEAEEALKVKSWHTICQVLLGPSPDNYVSELPLEMIQNARILNNRLDMELVLGFLCCPPEQREQVLEKVKA